MLQEKQWQPKGLLLRNDTVKTLDRGCPSGRSIQEKSEVPICIVKSPIVAENLKEPSNATLDQLAKSKQYMAVPENPSTSLNVGHVDVATHLEASEHVSTQNPNRKLLSIRDSVMVTQDLGGPGQVNF
ncbi:hypothetical protein ACH5RR_021557 [Cinchona calisaya]|uniref:Uncharacterized protein n=1 Tax=Cinchona calisaya TaxID=153742 RepID=A0ABD2ZHV8_9GENT